MKKIFLTIFCLPCLLSAVPSFAVARHAAMEKQLSEVPMIRVVLEDRVDSALVELKGAYSVVDIDNKKTLSWGMEGKRFPLFMIEEGLRWGEEYPGTYAVRLVPKSEKTFVYVNGRQYRGSLVVYGRDDGFIALVNEVPLEDFVNATLCTQVSSNLAAEALSALAISARTIAYKATLEGKAEGRLWDIAASEMNYQGYGMTRRKEVETAVIDTAHIVMMSEGNVPKNIQVAETTLGELANNGLKAQEILKKCGVAKFGSTVKEFSAQAQ